MKRKIYNENNQWILYRICMCMHSFVKHEGHLCVTPLLIYLVLFLFGRYKTTQPKIALFYQKKGHVRIDRQKKIYTIKSSHTESSVICHGFYLVASSSQLNSSERCQIKNQIWLRNLRVFDYSITFRSRRSFIIVWPPSVHFKQIYIFFLFLVR